MTASGRATRDAFAAFVGFGRGIWLFPLDTMFRTVGLRYGWLKALFTAAPPPLIRGIGLLRAERAAWRASRRVPAYGRYLEESGVDVASLFPLGILRHLPETDKKSYVDRYGLLERCVGGAVPYPGTTIDESSGSTGTPYNWIRGRKEREVAHRNIGFFARYAFGTAPLVTINAFSMGAWAAGMNMSMGMMRHGIVKSVGPDVDKILSTLAYLGPTYRFLISGYPPFLKHLIDEGERRGFPWADYELHGLVGGEGMTEELRDVLLARFASVFSGYGATDIEIGMAGESPVSIAVRRLARARPDIGRALFGPDSRLPMVFQYNPLIHYMEVNALGEVICTVSRLDLLAPRIRYNVHDSGGIVEFAKVARVLRTFGFDLDRLGESPEVHGPRGPLPWAQPDPAAVPVDPRPARRDDQRHGLEHLPRGHRVRPLPGPARRAAAPLVHALGRRRRDRHAAAGGRDRAGEPRGRRRRVAPGRGRAAPRRARRAEHRLPLVARRVPRRDAADRLDLRRGRRAVRRRRDADQAAPDRPDLIAVSPGRGSAARP